MPLKFLPAVFAIRRDQRVVAALGTARRCALLPCLLVSIDALVQAVDSHYESYRRVFGRRQHGQKEDAEGAVERRHADHHNLVSLGLP